MNIHALRQALRAKLDAAKAINAAAEKDGRLMTDDEKTQFNALMAEVETFKAEIARKEALIEADRAAGEGARADVSNDAKKPWASLGEQLQAVATVAKTQGRVVDNRLLAALGQNESVDAEGGFLIAPEYSAELFKRTYDVGLITSRCFQQPMSSNILKMNAVDEDSRADGSRWGGLQAYWAAEAAAYTSSKAKFRQMQLTANKLIALVYATEEQLEDGTALAAYINQAVPDELSFKMDDAAFNGPGDGMPLGVLFSNAAYVQAKDAGQAAKTVSSANILNMWSHLYGRSRKNAAWFINQDVEPQLYPLAFQNASGAVLFTGPMYTPPGVNGNNSEYGLLMGKPVIPVEQCATLGTQGDIVLADMSQYILGKKGGVRADSSIHVAFLTGEQAFRFMLRTDGQPLWKKPLTPKNGTNLLSPFVTLQAR